MKPNRPLLLGSYLVAFLLVTIPLVEVVTSLLPLTPGDPNWRFGAIGVFSRALMTPLLGLVLALGLAAFQWHRKVLGGLGVASVLAGAALVVILALFVLDAGLVRGQLAPEARRGFYVATVFASFKILFAAVTSVILGWGAWRLRASRQGRRRSASDSDPMPIVAGQS